MCTLLQLNPETTEAMDEQEKFMASTAAELSSLAQQIAASQHTFEVLQSSQHITEEEESDVFWGMRRWPNKLAEVSPFCSALQSIAIEVSDPAVRCLRGHFQQLQLSHTMPFSCLLLLYELYQAAMTPRSMLLCSRCTGGEMPGLGDAA